MTTLETFQTRKEEIIEKTLELLPSALSGDIANRTFFIVIDENEELSIDFHYYFGQIALSDNCFYTIKDIDTPTAEDCGYDSIEDVDFEAAGFGDYIAGAIEQHVCLLDQA